MFNSIPDLTGMGLPAVSNGKYSRTPVITSLKLYCVVITEEYNVTVNNEELTGTAVYLTIYTGVSL